MNRFTTTTCCLLGLLALSSFAPAQAAPKPPEQKAEDEIRTLRIIHPEGNDAERFVRSRHVAVGGIADVHEQDGVMLMDINEPKYNFLPNFGAFVETFKVIKPEDEQVLAGIKEFDAILLVESEARPDHWVVAGIMGIYPKELDQQNPNGWLPANFIKDKTYYKLLDLPKYRYQGFIDENLKLLKGENRRKRGMAMRMLGAIGPDDIDAVRVIDSIAGFINSKDSEDRSEALRAIGHIGGRHAERYIPLIAEKLEEGGTEQVEATAAICGIGGPVAQKHIARIAELMSAADFFPAEYLYHLGHMGEEASAALPAVLGLLESADKSNHDNMEGIIMTLGRIGPKDPKVVAVLTPLMKHENGHIRDLSKKALDGKFAKRPKP